MSKKYKGIIVILVLFIILIATFLCYTYAKDDKKVDNNTVETNVNTQNVNTADDKTNNVNANTVTNENVEIKNESVVPEEPPKKEETVETPAEANSEVQQDNEEEKAISIVKKDWGNTKGMAFRVEQINSDGSYVISVRNEDSVALEWYTVNPKTGTFTK